MHTFIDESIDPDMPELEEIDRTEIQEYLDDRGAARIDHVVIDHVSNGADFFNNEYYSMQTIFGFAYEEEDFAEPPWDLYELFDLRDVEYNDSGQSESCENNEDSNDNSQRGKYHRTLLLTISSMCFKYPGTSNRGTLHYHDWEWFHEASTSPEDDSDNVVYEEVEPAIAEEIEQELAEGMSFMNIVIIIFMLTL